MLRRREFSRWLSRARECRNPFILLQAWRYEQQRLRLLKLAAGLQPDEARRLIFEIENDVKFIEEIRDHLSARTQYIPRAVDFMIFASYGSMFFNEVTLYAIVRALQPEVVVETGGTPGKSSAFILRAMNRNGAGKLFTIDLPPPASGSSKLQADEYFHAVRPAGAESGWIIPDALRVRHHLLLGPSREHLPPLLSDLSKVDIFLHDSDHSYDNMMWEFETALKAMPESGLLLSDDILDNSSFFDFCKRSGFMYENVFNLGAARQPRINSRERASGI